MPDTPVTMIARLAAQVTGEREADWVRFFELYQPMIRRFAEYAGAKSDDSEDVAQDILVKLVSLFRNGRYNPGKGSFRAFLATMTRREVINNWYKAKVRGSGRNVSLDADEVSPEIAVPPETYAVLEAKWRLARHDAAVEHVLNRTALSAKSKAIYKAHVMDSRPVGEVAAAFGVPRNTVSQVKRRVECMIADYEEMLAE